MRGTIARSPFRIFPAEPGPIQPPKSNPRRADPGKLRLRRITVRDDVHVASDRMNFDAHELSYDPLAQLLTASGDEANPVVVFDNKDGSTTTASELQWNTKTDQFKVKKLGGKLRR